jgi:outer membrane protein OmpA-like peptidoglycan-associated protein
MTMKPTLAAFTLLSLPALGCASTSPTPELVDARRAYETARSSQQARYAPDRVLEAKQALDRAEGAHKDDAGSFDERSLAYIATRRSELAVIYGSYELDRRNHATYEATYKTRQDQLRRQAEGRADATQEELEGTRRTLGTAQSTLAGTREALTAEQLARKKAEATAAAAIASLQQVATVKEEARGMVITLDGSVLFISGKSELLPIAQKKLDDVAKALGDTDEKQKIVVEGHTDSNGNDENNQRLSQARAESVRNYLIQKGMKPERIQAVGKGEATPLASNDTPEGRANNRRVEIIVQKRAGQ